MPRPAWRTAASEHWVEVSEDTGPAKQNLNRMKDPYMSCQYFQPIELSLARASNSEVSPATGTGTDHSWLL